MGVWALVTCTREIVLAQLGMQQPTHGLDASATVDMVGTIGMPVATFHVGAVFSELAVRMCVWAIRITTFAFAIERARL